MHQQDRIRQKKTKKRSNSKAVARGLNLIDGSLLITQKPEFPGLNPSLAKNVIQTWLKKKKKQSPIGITSSIEITSTQYTLTESPDALCFIFNARSVMY